ncbi:MAG: Nif3-like dinuclear metal center hexameric protein [Desulfosarcina sp.]|nr:Nif3-like dinuclear metal center hexameric protein [Desulfobacterales bacterium]
MVVKVDDIIAALEALAPSRLAEAWDNVGLQVGHPEWSVQRILVALDPTPEVVEEAVDTGASVIITHHPLIFRPLRHLNLATAAGALVQRLIDERVAVISAHTNLDSVQGGINDVLAEIIGLKAVVVLQPAAADEQCGLGRVGKLDQPVRLEALVTNIQQRMGLPHIRYAGDPDRSVQRVAVCSGSGGSLLEVFLASPADVFVTGDVRYHDAREIEAHRRGVIDIGHFESERIIVQHLAERLSAWLAKKGLRATVAQAVCEKTPFKTVNAKQSKQKLGGDCS